MKKVLFATTALIATASVAAAEVRLSGYGRFGLDYNDGNNTNNNTAAGNNGISSTTLTSRLRLQVDMSAEADNGVAFGARFRAQAESRDNVPGGATFNGARFFVTSGGFTLGVGNIIGAFENASGLYLETRTADIGIDGAGFESVVANVNGEAFNWDAYSSAGAGVNGVEVLYSAGGFNGHISYSKTNNGLTTGGGSCTTTGGGGITCPGNSTPGAPDQARTAVSLSYTWNDWTFALAAQDSDRAFEDKVFVSVAGDIGQFGVRLAYADNDGIGKWGLYGNVDIGAASNLLIYVTDEDATPAADVAAGRADNSDAANAGLGREGTGYGIHYSYDLGGGVSFEAGAREASNDNTTVQAGVYFSF